MTPAIAATPEGQLAASIIEYVQVTRHTIANLRAARQIFIAPEPLTATCSHITSFRHGDEHYECPEIATVVNLADDAGYCLRHHSRVERDRA
jgi:hypothetical protein